MPGNRVNDEDFLDEGRLEAETKFDIQLYIYDMSKGLAKGLSAMFLGKYSLPRSYSIPFSDYIC